jgi:hypothetical protein
MNSTRLAAVIGTAAIAAAGLAALAGCGTTTKTPAAAATPAGSSYAYYRTMMGRLYGGGRDETFRVAGLTDPAITVSTGARVSIEVINADPDTAHGLVITTSQAASSWMPMMTAAEGPVASPPPVPGYRAGYGPGPPRGLDGSVPRRVMPSRLGARAGVGPSGQECTRHLRE